MALKQQITEAVDEQDILSTCQSGFRTKHNTTGLLLVTDCIYKNINGGKNVCLTMLDHSRAFDNLDRDILCKKLQLG
nr:unnamed protein product [Callosobruchus analis]